MNQYNIITETDQSTVIAEYTPEERTETDYQSEAELERELIRLLTTQGYERINVTDEAGLIVNLQRQLELLNDYTFTDNEWERFFREKIANANEGIVEKTRKIQDDYIQVLKRDNGSTKNVCLLDKKNIHNNRLQVLNQYEEDGGTHNARYDVTVLVNGLPMVHIELKRRGVAIREAFNQIKRYQRDSFWAASGLYEYVQIFVISNGTNTKYYSNTTRNSHIKEADKSERRKSKKTSNSFEFTSYWADATNRVINDLVDFTKTFFAKHTILNVLTKFCVFTSEQQLLVMRPYQIAATEKILERIVCSSNYKKTGTTDAGGYIWHTTGSGKTLTSFKTAQLATQLEEIEKVLFVVDRKDLDYQTMKEYDKFQKDSANSSKSTKQLEKNLNNPFARIIITTIQKLDIFVSRNKAHDIYKKHIVIIFDECHRSQFGDMHQKITKAFRNYHIFGFTGTPIFGEKCEIGKSTNIFIPTTDAVFGDKLHTYTIVDAIIDGNVLPFRIDYIDTIKTKDYITDKDVRAIDIEKALVAPERISMVTKYILEHFDQKTYRNQKNSTYLYKVIENVEKVASTKKDAIEEKRIEKKINGFNSIFAVSSILAAKMYYEEFKKQLAESKRKLTVAIIFSYSPNEEEADEEFENDMLDKSSRDFLETAIADYNATFNTNYSTKAEKFQNYYKDLSLRVKNREVDLLIVVNMFLTGFDATTLNTLWVDKNLKMHGLIQAFSRTNRILNRVKTFGNIVCFRNLEEATNEALAHFGNKETGGVVLMKPFKEYYTEYTNLIVELQEKFPLDKEIIDEERQKEFIRLFGAILKLKNILTAFDDFAGKEIINSRDFQDYQGRYLDIYSEIRRINKADKENINDDVIFELELIRQVEVNIDYILMLIEKYRDSNCADKEILVTIQKTIKSSIELRSKKKLIENFIEQINIASNVSDDWRRYVSAKKEEELSSLIAVEQLNDSETRRFIGNAFRDGSIKSTGTDIDKILPPVSRFGGGRAEKKHRVIAKLTDFFEKYFGLG